MPHLESTPMHPLGSGCVRGVGARVVMKVSAYLVLMASDVSFAEGAGKDSNDYQCVVESAASDCFTAQRDTEMVSGGVERGMMILCQRVRLFSFIRKMEAFGDTPGVLLLNVRSYVNA